MDRIKKNFRTIIQIITTVIYNYNITGIFNGKIKQGATKGLCVPGLNCYSCPAAGFGCPLGALQQSYIKLKRGVNTYVIGLILLFSTVFGRIICGFACPFGFLQELLYRIPTKKIKASLEYVRWIKYVVLALFVVALPICVSIIKGTGYPAFCKYICPQGTIAGGLLMLADETLRSLLGSQFIKKLIILVVILVLSVFIYRPFCRIMCPLGAIYGLFNSIALIRINVDTAKCSNCGACSKQCPVSLDPVKQSNHPECVRCGKCIEACNQDAVHYCFMNSSGGNKNV